jgi:translin
VPQYFPLPFEPPKAASKTGKPKSPDSLQKIIDRKPDYGTLKKQLRKGREMTNNLDLVGPQALAYLEQKHAARERALPKSRSAIRHCANSIRAIHRHEFATAERLLQEAGKLLSEMTQDLREQPDIFYAGFVQDAQKEYAEASTFFAMTQKHPLPMASALEIDWAPYLNGLGEAVGELRRYVLDHLRHNDIENSETYLNQMDDIYALLTTIDFPDAITGGLRRTTDAARGILEKTRGDLTVAVGQAQLQRSLLALQQELQKQ